jgi:signal transduction histidine kinase
MSLRTRLIFSYTLIVVLCLSIVAVAMSAILQSYRDRFATARLDDMTRPIYVQARSLARREASLDEVWANLKEQSQSTGVYILLVDGEGKAIRQVSPQENSQEQPAELLSIELPRRIPRLYHGTYETSSGQTFIFVAYPLAGIFGSQKPPGLKALILSVPRGGALALWASLVRPFFWAGLIALSISVVIAILLARSIYRPLQRVTEAAEKMAQGQYDHEVPVAGPREVKALAVGFNQMARQVKLSEQRLRYFIADASHQLRTPLTSIRGFARAILDGTANDGPTRLRAAQVIEDESKRMMRQVDELLELSRMESGQIQMAREPIDIKELLEHCREIFTIRAEEKGILLKTEIEPLMPVVGDIDRLEQVFSNLLDNALKNSPAGGEVKVIGRNTSTDSLQITVADSGPGIHPDQLPYVFERFYQAGGVGTGSGLGLAIAREIVLAHGGGIEVNSAPGEGAEFIVRLPAGAPGSSA